MLYSRKMQPVRSGRLARFVAIVLLLWAGADLANVNLCAIDRPPVSVPGTHARISVVPSPDSSGSPITGDDCFCCSHSAMCAAVFISTLQVLNVDRVCLPPAQHTQLLRTRLDHPPQLV